MLHVNQPQDMKCVNSPGLIAKEPSQHTVPKLTHIAAMCQAIQHKLKAYGNALTELSEQSYCIHVAMDVSNTWQTPPCNKSLQPPLMREMQRCDEIKYTCFKAPKVHK